MKHVVLFCFVLFCFVAKSQNLVPNYSFEQSYDCISGRLDNAINWHSVNAGIGINAHYQTCQSDLWVKAPRQYLDNCFQTYQTIRTGNAYTEFGVYVTQSSTQESNHPAVKLSDTLAAGKVYCVTYYVSLMNHVNYSIDKLGALFTPTPFPYYITGTTTPSVAIAGQYTPQIVTTPGVVFEDTLGWEEVSGSFTAVGNESYLTLGDFFFHSHHLIKNSYPTNCNSLAGYYVDDVSVEVVEIAKAKNDTLIYAGDSVLVGSNNSEAALFSWQPTAGLSCTNCPNPKASPSVATTYTVTKTQCKAVTSDIITITVSPTSVNENEQFAKKLFIYPNPSKDKINIKINAVDTEHFYIKLTGVLGNEIISDKLKTELDISFLENGIYFLSFYKNDQLLITKKVVKQ